MALQAQLDQIQRNTSVPPKVEIHEPAITVVPPTPKSDSLVVLEKMESPYHQPNPTGSVPLLFVVGKPPGMNIFYVNKGNARAIKVRALGHAYVADGPESTTVESKVVSDFKKLVRAQRWTGNGGVVEPGSSDEFFFTAMADGPITADDLTKLATGQKSYYILSLMKYEDDSGPHHIQMCRVLQATPQATIWHFCSDFSEER